MIKRKFITFILVAIMSIFCLSGCSVVSTETTSVEATVVDTYHQPAWTQPILVGKAVSFIYHPAQYKVTMTYKDYILTVNNEELYYAYTNNIGATVKCNLVTTYWDDGTAVTELKWENKND